MAAQLRYQVRLTHRRSQGDASSHDAWVGSKLALFRADKAFPITGWRLRKGGQLHGELAVAAPDKWSIITPYLPDTRGKLLINNPGDRKARPLGWIIAGDIGTRRDVIAGMEITVSAPRGIRMERIAMLALLRWTLPQLVPALGKPSPYVNIVAAGEPMWLGALSAPNSIFVNASRPLISENGTSTIVHEMVHVLLADLKTPADQDWIDEGLAEYFALRALLDSGTISQARYVQTIASLQKWGSKVRSMRTASSTGPVSARAVTVFHELDAELRQGNGKPDQSGRPGKGYGVRRTCRGTAEPAQQDAATDRADTPLACPHGCTRLRLKIPPCESAHRQASACRRHCPLSGGGMFNKPATPRQSVSKGRMRRLLARRIWLPGPIYAALPFLYLLLERGCPRFRALSA